jgi:hypothetical protein
MFDTHVAGNNQTNGCQARLINYYVTRSGATTIVLIKIILGCIFDFLFRSFSIEKNIEVVSHLKKMRLYFVFNK